MNIDQIFLVSLLGILVVFFVWEQVTLRAGLFIATIPGIIPADEAFLGFDHPAVVTWLR